MQILVLGSGAREHALARTLSLEPGVTRVLCAPGNPGIARHLPTWSVDPADPRAVLQLVEREAIDLTIVGPEAPLAAGIADAFLAAARPLFGPTRAAAQLETSKAFAKDFMARHEVPTARYRVFDTTAPAIACIRSGELGPSVVVKADGLAAGKGVIVAPDHATAEAAVRAALDDRAFGDAGARVVLEECLEGPEVSYFVVADGDAWVPLPSAQDHKRLLDDDLGPNTGGMGAYAPSPLLDEALTTRIEREIVGPVLRGMVADGTPFRGFLYCGLMITRDGPKVIEFNVRFGDPEAQVVLPLVTEALAPMLMAAATGRLAAFVAARRARPPATGRSADEVAVGVVLAAEGYPSAPKTGDAIHGLDALAGAYPDVQVFYAGVKERDGRLVSGGGRVLTVVARARSFAAAIERAYAAAAQVSFDGCQYRRDIGRRLLKTPSV